MKILAMYQSKKVRVFVSYSRHDESLVKPLAALIGLDDEERVFLDIEQLRPGDLWERKLLDAVRESSIFVLCWCCSSATSIFVRKEIITALLDEHKRVVPVLFCSERLPDSLSAWQWIDLRGRVVHKCVEAHDVGVTIHRSDSVGGTMVGGTVIPDKAVEPIQDRVTTLITLAGQMSPLEVKIRQYFHKL